MHPLIAQIKSHVRVEHVFLAILILAIVLRFCFLDLKLFHHDESIHAWFSYRLLTTGYYEYDPTYHGPFLYYVTAGMFSLFGSSDLVARILPCIFGCAVIPLVYWIYRMKFINAKVACVAALFIAVSPEMVYFSRFLRNDVFVIFFSLLMVAAMLAWMSKGKWQYLALAGASAALGLCCKENMPIIILTFAVFFLYLVWSRKFALPKHWIRDALIAAAVFFGIVFTMYTSFWQYPEMVLNAGPMAIQHWLEMHNQQRLGGPAVFYLLMFILYEIPILILAVLGVGRFLYRPKKLHAEAAAEDEADAELALQKFSLRKFLKEVFSRPAAAPINREREFMRFAIYWTIIACITYAYIGEKVPWLSLHQILPMVFVAAFGLFALKKYWWKIVLVISVGILLVIMAHVAFTPADIDEPIVQVQYSEELVPLMEKIDNASKVAIVTDQAWPFMWYYRGDAWDKFYYFGKLISDESAAAGDYDIIIGHDTDAYESLDGYNKSIQRLSYWFDAAATYAGQSGNDLLNWVKYYFTRDGASGSYNLAVFTRG
ncbi:MAG: TIGR03663 family protein [Methanocorpusculum sp.]|nr:TIGR03663 family protein [Methanocorpusculum sp.]